MNQKNALERWTTEDSADLYHIREWGAGYFNISEDGDVVVTPIRGKKEVSISLSEVISGILERGYDMPVILRIDNILNSQITQMHESFRAAINQFKYRGEFLGVYPIKVNQQQQVVESITQFGAKYHHGLEAGSKAELIAALSFLQDKKSCLICNGYKDSDFVDLGLYARKMGYPCFFVIEMPSELDLILERSKVLNVRPLLGVRFRLSTKAGGHWTETGGDRSIFGLNTSQIIDIVDLLKKEGMLDTLQLLHYHLGSQIPNIRDIRSAVIEACRVYSGLVREGAQMGYFDIGGGLAVDYDGSNTNFMNSRNYSLDEYCADVIESIMQTLDENDIDHPTIITESGRATVAYHSILLFNILDVGTIDTLSLPKDLPDDTHEAIQNLMEAYKTLTVKNIQECFNDAIYYRDQVRGLFKHGELTLRERSIAEQIFWNIIKTVNALLKNLKYVPKDLKLIDVALSDIYYSNFSVFQSLPDAWAIGHLFPVMPIHRLNEMPTRKAILADITCDCDGKMDRFIDMHGVQRTLPLHEMRDDEEYYLGAFLVGAYQETLGDLHNLLGDTNVFNIHVYEDGTYRFSKEIPGDTVSDVLSYVEYDPKLMMEKLRQVAERAIWEKQISPQERRKVMKKYADVLRGYTYFTR